MGASGGQPQAYTHLCVFFKLKCLFSFFVSLHRTIVYILYNTQLSSPPTVFPSRSEENREVASAGFS